MIFGIYTAGPKHERALIRRILGKTKDFRAGGELFTDSKLGLRACGEGASLFKDRITSRTIAYKGELYNYAELRHELEGAGCLFASNLESELVLLAYGRWGEACQERFNGIWAFAIWDGASKELFCSRDRFGQVPFYYFFGEDRFVFCTRIRPLFSCPFIKTEPNPGVIFDYLVAPRTDHPEETFYRDIKKLGSGCCLRVSAGKKPAVRRYYQPVYNPQIGKFSRREFKKYAAEFRRLLELSVKARLRAPHPGCMLSGGIDSSSIAYLADKLVKELPPGTGARPKVSKNFSLAYKMEAKQIGKVSRELKLKQYLISPANITSYSWKEITGAALSYEKPLTDPSFLGEKVIFEKAAKENLRVLLGGIGADELLAGHRERYSQVYLNQLIQSGDIPAFIKELKILYAGRLGEMQITGRIKPEFYKTFLRMQLNPPQPPEALLTRTISKDFFNKYWRRKLRVRPGLELNLQKILRRDTLGFGDEYRHPDTVWGRQPFLDHRLVEYVFSLPACYKFSGGWAKYLLREAMSDALPAAVCWNREKLQTPIEPWKAIIKRDSARMKAVLSGPKLHSAAYLNQTALSKELDTLVAESLAPGTIDISLLWRYVNLELWMRENARLEKRRCKRPAR